MSEEIRHSAQARRQLSDNYDSADAALRELRAYARALRERVERLEAQLQQAEEVAAKMRVNTARKNGKLSTPSSRIRHS
jgi:predicted  nucleic acid-binding Zn-ribbon protein